jgi:CheY-like chemotaxis protein
MLVQGDCHLGGLSYRQEEPVSAHLLETLPRPQRPPQAPRLAVLSRSLLLREALARRLALLNVEITAVADFEALARELQSDRPALVLVDGDGWERPWDALIRGLKLKRKGIPALLLIASLNVEQVLEAPALGISAVLLKPFKPEEHTARIYDQFLGAQAQTARRAHPRYVPSDGQGLEMEILPEGDWVPRKLPVLDISAGGARMELPDPPAAARLVPGSRWAAANLGVGAARAGVSFRVVHRAPRSIGVAFEQLIDKSGAFREALQRFDRQVFGSVLPRRAW